MRIVVWNCKMALSRKRRHLYDLRPDIAVIPECSRNCLELCLQDGFEGRWFGDNPRKGLGVLVAKPLHIARAGKPRSRYVVPISISGGPCAFLLIAVWTLPVPGSHVRSYIGQLHEALVNHPQWFTRKPAIVCGDFNSNVFWDHLRPNTRRPKNQGLSNQNHNGAKPHPNRPNRIGANTKAGHISSISGNHSAVVSLLEKRRLASAYHHFFSEPQGAETQPTYYFWHHKNRPYHIDYIFLPRAWASQITAVQLGSHSAYSHLSDHVPLSVDLSLSSI